MSATWLKSGCVPVLYSREFGLDIFERSHRGCGYLHLDLVITPDLGFTPIVRSNERLRSGGGNDRRADIIRGCAKLARQHPVYVNVHGWIAKRLFEFDQSRNSLSLRFFAERDCIALHVAILWAMMELRGRRRAEVRVD